MVGSRPNGPTKGTGAQSEEKDTCTKAGEGCRAVAAMGDWLHSEIDQKSKYKKDNGSKGSYKSGKIED